MLTASAAASAKYSSRMCGLSSVWALLVTASIGRVKMATSILTAAAYHDVPNLLVMHSEAGYWREMTETQRVRGAPADLDRNT